MEKEKGKKKKGKKKNMIQNSINEFNQDDDDNDNDDDSLTEEEEKEDEEIDDQEEEEEEENVEVMMREFIHQNETNQQIERLLTSSSIITTYSSSNPSILPTITTTEPQITTTTRSRLFLQPLFSTTTSSSSTRRRGTPQQQQHSIVSNIYPSLFTISPSSNIFHFVNDLSSFQESENEMVNQVLDNSIDTFINERYQPTKNKYILLKKETIYSEQINEEKCPICLEKFDNNMQVYILPCIHTFHCSCLEIALEYQHVTCPFCRKNIPYEEKTSNGDD